MSLQVPPFWHWTDLHLEGAFVGAAVGYWVGLTNGVSHLEPVKLGVHTQMPTEAVDISLHVPPFIHEIVEQLLLTGTHGVVVWAVVGYVVFVVIWGVVNILSQLLPVKLGGHLVLF